MKRRNFIKTTALAGLAGTMAQGGAAMARHAGASVPGFDLHPFVRTNPGAVFIQRISPASRRNTGGIRDAACGLSRKIIVPVASGGYPLTTRITVNPGATTDPAFVDGLLHAMRDNGSSEFFHRESGGDMDIIDIPDGVVFRKMGFMAPMNRRGTFLVNIARLHTQDMDFNGTVTNLRSIAGHGFRPFHTPYDLVRGAMAPRYRDCLHDNYESRIEDLYADHVKRGLPNWARPGVDGGIRWELLVQQTLDAYSVTPTGINIVTGAHNGRPDTVIFGVDPFRVDIVAHWLAGHEPGNAGLFHIGIERGMSDVLDPRDIPVYRWENGMAVAAPLDEFPRMPLAARREEEPFDYAPWIHADPLTATAPSLDEIGRDHLRRPVFGLSLRERDRVHIAITNSRGERIWRTGTPELAPGVHQVVWDGVAAPGLYTIHATGMGWDVTRLVMV